MNWCDKYYLDYGTGKSYRKVKLIKIAETINIFSLILINIVLRYYLLELKRMLTRKKSRVDEDVISTIEIASNPILIAFIPYIKHDTVPKIKGHTKTSGAVNSTHNISKKNMF